MVIMHSMKCWLCFIIKFFCLTTAQQYNLTGSSEFASLGEAFTWRCEMFLPPSGTTYFVKFYRNNVLCVLVGSKNSNCVTQSSQPPYKYKCVSNSVYSLTIPAQFMTEFEQRSVWRCEYHNNVLYKSPDITMQIAVDVHNVSLIPNVNSLSIIEHTLRKVQCIVNMNAVPAPTITWYLGIKDITSTAGTNTTFITLTGNRTDNTKKLECRATNNNKSPKTASTTLNVEYSPSLNALSQQNIIEGRNLSVICIVTPGNPKSTTLYWTKGANFRSNGTTLQISNIQKTSSGTYLCNAENNYSDGKKGTDSLSMVVNVQYPPVVNIMLQQDILEGSNLSVTCQATPGNPNSTTFYWTKVDNAGFQQNRATLQILSVQRNESGTYRCTAENNYSNGEKGTSNELIVINVQYPPVVNTMLQQDILEGSNLSVTCRATPGNPNSTTFYWTKVDNAGFQQNRTTLQILSVQRTESGTYRCTAENNYNNSEKGTSNELIVINVQYQPTIEHKPQTVVNESEKVFLFRNISSNPLSNASWYDGTELLITQTSARTTYYTLERASCEDSKNFSLVVTNGIGNAVNTSVELIVNCKPKPDRKNITLVVTDTTGIEFSSTVVAYPEPLYELIYKNGTKNNQMMGSIIRNAINNFTYRFNQTVVNKDDYGTYHLVIHNDFGAETIFVSVLPQKSPDSATNVKVKCEETSAQVQWMSSFDGGDTQTFTVFVLSGLDKIIISDGISDKGENKVHDNHVENLQPSSTYTFYVSAQNRRGNSSSENITCTTSKKDKKAGSIQRLKQEDESENTNDDGLKDNVLYISAGPKVDQSEAAVYAEVNKKGPESNNNANMYAEVKKGFSKNDVSHKNDPKPKQKKGKKKKSKQDVADVYENSENIAMTSNMDSVFSNAKPKDKNKEERGYKNKDGLLYVEVKFDTTSNKGNPVIHGENEKTDYATVDFPMPTTPHDDDKI